MSTELPEDIPDALRLAIEKIIDSRVEAKWNALVAQHADVFNKN
jgi:hypothetical protein